MLAHSPLHGHKSDRPLRCSLKASFHPSCQSGRPDGGERPSPETEREGRLGPPAAAADGSVSDGRVSTVRSTFDRPNCRRQGTTCSSASRGRREREDDGPQPASATAHVLPSEQGPRALRRGLQPDALRGRPACAPRATARQASTPIFALRSLLQSQSPRHRPRKRVPSSALHPKCRLAKARPEPDFR